MTPQDMPVKVDDKMNDVLDVFQAHGNVTTGFIVDETGYTRPTITKRLDRLHAADCITYLHEPTALWQLQNDPRENE